MPVGHADTSLEKCLSISFAHLSGYILPLHRFFSFCCFPRCAEVFNTDVVPLVDFFFLLLVLLLLVSYLKNQSWLMSKGPSSLCFLSGFYSIGLYTYIFNSFWVNFCELCTIGLQFHFSPFLYLVFQYQYVEEIALSSTSVCRCLVKRYLTGDVWIYLWGLWFYFGLVSVFVPVPHHTQLITLAL